MKKLVTYMAALVAGLVSVSAAVPQKVSLSLEQCRELMNGNDVRLKNSRLDSLAAVEQKKEAFAEFFPQISVSAFGFYSIDPMLQIGVKDILGNNELGNKLDNLVAHLAPKLGINPIYSTLQYGFSASVSVMQPVYAGRRVANGNKLADLGIKAATLQDKIERRSSSEDMEKAYWQVVSLEEKLLTVKEAQSTLKNVQKDVDAAYKAGIATQNDFLQVKLENSKLRTAEIQIKNGIRLSKMNLFNMIGVEYTVVEAVADSLRPYLDSISLSDRLSELQSPYEFYVPEEEMAAGLDESELLALSVEAKRLEKKMTLGEALPQLAVGASYGYSELVNGKFNGSVYAMLRIPISDWGKVTHKLRRQEYSIQKAQNEKDYLSAQLLLQVRQLWLNLTSAWEQLQVALESVDVARQNMEMREADYRAGMISLSELMQARTSLRQVEDEYTDKAISYKNALTEYCGRANQNM